MASNTADFGSLMAMFASRAANPQGMESPTLQSFFTPNASIEPSSSRFSQSSMAGAQEGALLQADTSLMTTPPCGNLPYEDLAHAFSNGDPWGQSGFGMSPLSMLLRQHVAHSTAWSPALTPPSLPESHTYGPPLSPLNAQTPNPTSQQPSRPSALQLLPQSSGAAAAGSALQQYSGNGGLVESGTALANRWGALLASLSGPQLAMRSLEQKPAQDMALALASTSQHSQQGGVDSQRTKSSVEEQFVKRMAQNREAARRSRQKKKQYIKTLEQNNAKLAALEREIEEVKKQGAAQSAGVIRGAPPAPAVGAGAAFEAEYKSFLEDFKNSMQRLRQILECNGDEKELAEVVDTALTHALHILKKKAKAVKQDVFYLLSGMWKSPVERCFMFVGGHRPSQVVLTIKTSAQELTSQQSTELDQLLEGTKQEEERITRSLEELQESLMSLLVPKVGSADQEADSASKGSDLVGYMTQMASALSRMEQLEQLVIKSDALRFGSLNQAVSVLSPKQGAAGLLAVFGELARMQKLSELWESGTVTGVVEQRAVLEPLQLETPEGVRNSGSREGEPVT